MNQLLTYWVTLALMRGVTTRRKNEIYVQCFRLGRSVADIFEDNAALDLTDQERQCIIEAKTELSNNAFLVESMLNQGYAILPIDSPEYPRTLKANLKAAAPTVLYAKGNLALLQEPSVAIVGSRSADGVSLEFTDNVARLSAANGRVVVSGFAKGVDRQALDSTIGAGGKSIIVLPQGILTFAAGFKQYYKPMVEGRLAVVSEFAPNAGWSVGLAMARNATIYGLAASIFVAQSDSKGGTWEGVAAGLKSGRDIYIRRADSSEKSANNLLIKMGAKAVDINGMLLPDTNEPGEEEQILKILEAGPCTCRQILALLNNGQPEASLRKALNLLPGVESFKSKNCTYYRLKDTESPTLFS